MVVLIKDYKGSYAFGYFQVLIWLVFLTIGYRYTLFLNLYKVIYCVIDTLSSCFICIYLI